MGRRLKSVLFYIGGMLLLGFVSGLAGGWVAYLEASDPALAARIAPFELVSIAVLGVAGMVVALVASVRWMRVIDEAAREAHKSAWFWGGSVGLLAAMPILMMAVLPQTADWRLPDWFFGRTDPMAYAAMGAWALISLMLLGYGVAWAWWWWKRR